MTALQKKLAEALRAQGASVLFGLIGGGNFALAGAFRDSGGRYIGLRHEMNAVAAADSYARTTGKVGLATVTQGPGLTHAVTAIVEAAKSHTPLLLLAADSAIGDTLSNQSVCQPNIAIAADAGYVRWTRPMDVTQFVEAALEQARRERRPILVGFPPDFTTDPAGAELAASDSLPAVTGAKPKAAHVSLDTAADLLCQATRPTILAGRGAHLSSAGPDLIKLAEHLGAVLATTAMADGLFSGHPQSAGVSGGFGDDHDAAVLADTDVLLVVGAALTSWTTRHGELYRNASIIHLDDRADAFGRYTPAHHHLLGDAAHLASELRARVVSVTEPRPERSAGVAAQLSDRESEVYEELACDGRLNPRALTVALDELIPLARCVTIDGGHFSGWPVMHMRAESPEALLYPHGFQTIGLGIGSVVGVATARTDRVPVLAVGDGGLLMSLGELDTLLTENIPALVIVYNDDAYGAELHAFAGAPNLDMARLPERDFASIFVAMGGRAETIKTLADLTVIREWLESPTGPLLLDCRVSRGVVAPWLRFAFSHDHGNQGSDA
ncbi:MAG: thiamine pyrophosphate-binding protein [Micromonosporaceae bacterium]